ncbi:MAG TPA: hypothetical protein VFJ19_17330 [Nocardioidaceae bacterium]|nr:hypothetical protein [Nocardioidaceae bacterium]
MHAIGADPSAQYYGVELGSPDYLTSGRRADIIEQRDRWLESAGA